MRAGAKVEGSFRETRDGIATGSISGRELGFRRFEARHGRSIARTDG